MAFLDFIKNRQASEPQPAAQKSQEQKPDAAKPETAKEMYTREAAQEKANRIAPTPDQKQRAQKIGEVLNKATQHRDQAAPARPDAPDEGGTNDAQIQKQNQQGKTQEALSPTDDARGQTVAQEQQPAPEKTTERAQQTVARRPPSWER
jgi:hypothetical protein